MSPVEKPRTVFRGIAVSFVLFALDASLAGR